MAMLIVTYNINNIVLNIQNGVNSRVERGVINILAGGDSLGQNHWLPVVAGHHLSHTQSTQYSLPCRLRS